MKLKTVLIFFLAAVIFCEQSFSDEAVRIGIMKFDAKTSGISSRHTESITDELTRVLANSYSIAIVDRANFEAIAREQRIGLSGLVNPRTAAKIGRIAGIQYMIFGSVTHFEVGERIERSDTSSVVDAIGDVFNVKSRVRDPFRNRKAQKIETAEVTLDVSVIDVNTGEIVLAISETGTAQRSLSGGSSGSGFRDSASSRNMSLQDAAISDAVSRIGQRIKEAVVGEYPQVLSAEGRDIILSLGATSGVRIGNLYKITSEGTEIRDMQGNIVGRRSTPIAVVRVDEVQNNFSVSHVVRNGGHSSSIRRGDKIEFVSQGEADELINRNAFHRNRPPRRPDEYSDSRRTDYYPKPEPRPVPEPEPEPEPRRDDYYPPMPARNLSLENHSDKAEKVIAGYAAYGMTDDERNALLERHKRAEKMLSREEKFDRYSKMFQDNPDDYFAAYQAAKTAFECGWYTEAKDWAEKSLAVNYRYSPAKRLHKAAVSKM